jgi:hypothetical protein
MKRGRSSRVEPGVPWPVRGAQLSIASWVGGAGRSELRLAQFRHGSSGDLSAGRGPCRSNGLLSGEDVPAGLGELAGDLHPGHLGAALSAKPLLGALVMVAVAGVVGGVDGRLDQRPTQLGRAVVGQRAALVAAAGLVHPGAQPGIAAPLLGRWEPGAVAQLGGDGVAQHSGDPRCGHQQRHLGVVGAEVPQLPFAAVDLVVEAVDEGQGCGDVADPWLG